ncbi:hypothetical protein [Rhizobium tibeticum]|nr:hypothetical protein [Rhizobium tibeticum]
MVVDILEQLLAGQFLEDAHGAPDAPVAVAQAHSFPDLPLKQT